MANVAGKSDQELEDKLLQLGNDIERTNINGIMMIAPQMQIIQNELSSRFIRRSTVFIIIVGVLSLLASCATLAITYATTVGA